MRRARYLSNTNGNMEDSFVSLMLSSWGNPALLTAFCPELLQAALTTNEAESVLAGSHVRKDSA